MPKYLGKQIFSHGSFPEAESVEEEKKVGENNGQLRFVCHHGWLTQARLDQFDSQWGSQLFKETIAGN